MFLHLEEKEIRNKRREIQEKLLKFGAKIPVFMYLTDYREETLKDVITQLEPKLFKKVTSLSVQDFELLLLFVHFELRRRLGGAEEPDFQGRGCLMHWKYYIEQTARCWWTCLLYTSPSPRDLSTSRMPSSA